MDKDDALKWEAMKWFVHKVAYTAQQMQEFFKLISRKGTDSVLVYEIY